MRKNKMMRAASALLVAVLLTTSTISGTFAKYVTTSEAKDEARVAKWGVELQVVGNLYGETYKDSIVADTAATDEFTVQAVHLSDNTVAESDVVAPGTKNEDGFTFSLKGQPEVDGIITSEMKIQNIFLEAGSYGVMLPVNEDVVTEENYSEFFEKEGGELIVQLYYKDGDKFYAAPEATWADREYYTLEDAVVVAQRYYPVVYKLDNGDDGENATDYKDGTIAINTMEEIATIIETQLGLTPGAAAADTSVTYTGTKAFEANDNLAEVINLDDKVITWAWSFTDVADVIDNIDKMDTILGMLMAKDITPDDDEDSFIVVKLNDNDTPANDSDDYFEAPTEYTDYCLDTKFELKITVAQTD
ncbi:MAG: hypothetical protein IJA17_03655 [Oscillospiraceae bacterium]|nr:hypothetical protein [Oscillospiraceae bacterium]